MSDNNKLATLPTSAALPPSSNKLGSLALHLHVMGIAYHHPLPPAFHAGLYRGHLLTKSFRHFQIASEQLNDFLEEDYHYSKDHITTSFSFHGLHLYGHIGSFFLPFLPNVFEGIPFCSHFGEEYRCRTFSLLLECSALFAEL